MYECLRVHEMSPRTSMTYRTSCWAPYALRASVDVWGQWCLRSLDYRCAVQTCMGFDFIFIRTGTCFPSPYHLLLASVSKDAAPPLTSAPTTTTTTSINSCFYLLLVRATAGGKNCSRPMLLMSKCQKFCKIHTWQLWLKVISVRNSSHCERHALCRRLQVCWVLHLSLQLRFLIERPKKMPSAVLS